MCMWPKYVCVTQVCVRDPSICVAYVCVWPKYVCDPSVCV